MTPCPVEYTLFATLYAQILELRLHFKEMASCRVRNLFAIRCDAEGYSDPGRLPHSFACEFPQSFCAAAAQQIVYPALDSRQDPGLRGVDTAVCENMPEDLEDELCCNVMRREPLDALSSFPAIADELTVDILVCDLHEACNR